MTRITACFLGMVFALAAPALLPGQDYSPPAANQPSAEALKEIARKTSQLDGKIARLRKQIPPVPDHLLADAEVYLRAAQAIVKHNEFFHKDSTAWTLEALDRGLWRAHYLAGADTPWLAVSGKTVARGYRSQVDGSVQPFAVSYPIDFGKDPKRRWRVDVVLHGRDTSLTEVKFLHANNGERAVPKEQDWVQINIFGRGNNAYRWSGETDVFEALNNYMDTENFARRIALFDPNRVILRGFSMGGAGTWHLGLHFPDKWCCIGPGAGFTTTHGYVAKLANPLPPYQEACLHIYDAVDYALNAFDVPVVAYSGANDPQKKAADNIEAALKRADVAMDHLVAPGLAHQFPPQWFKKANELYTKYAEKGRPSYPEAVSFITYTMKYAKCDWITLLGLEKHYVKASVLAVHTVAGYSLRTRNVSALRITLENLAQKSPQDITIDEQKLIAVPHIADDGQLGIVLQRRAGKWLAVLPQRLATQQAQHPRKVKDLQGPIDDAFAGPFLCVRGTGKGWHEAPRKAAAARLQRFGNDWSKYWRGTLPAKDDTEVTADDIANRHLILFGDPASNALIAQVLDGLPLEWTKDEIRFAGQKVEADQHIPVLIYPNPLNTQRYVVLNSGHTIPAADYTKTNALLFPRLGDYALLRIAPTAEDPAATEVVTAGLFDDSWTISLGSPPLREKGAGAASPLSPWLRGVGPNSPFWPSGRRIGPFLSSPWGNEVDGGAFTPGAHLPSTAVPQGQSGTQSNDGIIPAGAKLEKLWSQGEFTEGPAYGPDGCVYFSDIGNRIMKYDPRTGKTSEYRKPSGRANGLDFDPMGRLVACEGANTGGNRRVTVTEKDGKIRVLADRYKGKRFNSPNDLTIDTKGRIYFTDPRYVGAEPLELKSESVYRIDPDGTVTRIISDVTKPNGIILAPDMKTLYLAESHPKGDRLLLAYPLNADGSVGAKKVLHDFKNDRGIDGMCVDVKGNIYGAAGQGKTGGIAIFTRAGKKIGFIATPETPSNCVFGGADHKTLYITAGRSLYRIRLNAEGFAVFWPK